VKNVESSAKHYENEVSFFQGFLDGYLKYGSGYFEPGDTFEQASVRMLDRAIDASRLADKAQTKGKVRVLDIGSGWGSVFRRLGERLGDALEYHQVNPSGVQRQFIADTIGSAAWTHDAGLESAALGDRTYDAVFVHDSYCHLKNKGAMLGKLAAALAPGGRIVLQDTFFASELTEEQHRAARTTKFIQDDVFGFAEILAVPSLLRDAASAGLRVASLEDVSEHYTQTVAAWLARLGGLDAERFPLRDRTMRMLRQGGACMGYTTLHYLAVLAPHEASRQSLKETLRAFRASERSAEHGAEAAQTSMSEGESR
jgi:cyclopropane-fatty-acyl-phospholipid synthase